MKKCTYLGKGGQYYICNTFDPDLMDRFNAKFQNNPHIVRLPKPFKYRYLAGFFVPEREPMGIS